MLWKGFMCRIEIYGRSHYNQCKCSLTAALQLKREVVDTVDKNDNSIISKSAQKSCSPKGNINYLDDPKPHPHGKNELPFERNLVAFSDIIGYRVLGDIGKTIAP